MSSSVNIYVGPYIILTGSYKPGFWRDFEATVFSPRSELDKDCTILIPNNIRFGKWIDPKDYDEHTLEVVNLALHPVVGEIAKFAQYAEPFTHRCVIDGVKYEWHWGLVPYFS